ncbi:hypothetical protein C8Q78DRAFT_1062658 [Trametes maxima]|nr:hypothetical protein C8Q78DRAFT_1062658 [Trametes maxima]
MYYPQQSPGIAHKLPTHQHPGQVHDQSPWGRHPGYGPANGAQPPTSPAYPLFAHANGTMTAMQHHPHQPMHGALTHHHHHNSLTHPQFSSPPNGNGLQGPHGALGQAGSPGPISTQMMTAHWQQQLLKCEVRHDMSYSLQIPRTTLSTSSLLGVDGSPDRLTVHIFIPFSPCYTLYVYLFPHAAFLSFS